MISLRIAEIRSAKKLTQADVAQYLKITQQTYSAYEKNKRQMNYETLCLLADFYGVSTDYLLGRQEVLPSFLNEDERAVIEQYKALGERGKSAVKNCLAFEYAGVEKAENGKKVM